MPCELNEVPCVSSVVPWQPWFFGRKGDPAKGFAWTYHLFWGLEDVIANFTNGWKTVETNKKVGGLFPNDGDGNAWGDKELGFPEAAGADGLHAHRPRPLPERHAGLQRADRGLQARQRRDRDRRGDPARRQDLPHAGAAAGLQAEGHHAGQGAAVPGRDRGAGRAGLRPVDRGVVEPVASVHFEPHRSRARSRSPRPTRPARRSSGRSRSALRMRCSKSRPTRSRARSRPRRPTCAMRSPPPRSTRSSAR